ncbi:hypothetical protein ACFX2I_026113 [Malus domestica]
MFPVYTELFGFVRAVYDRIRRRHSSASTYDVPEDSKAEEQSKVQESSSTYHEECRPADKFPPGRAAYWLAIAEEFNEGMAAGSGTKLTPEEEEANLRYGPCERCGKEKDHATKNCPLKTIWI